MASPQPTAGRAVVRLVSTGPSAAGPDSKCAAGSSPAPEPRQAGAGRRRTLYRPWIVGPAILTRPPQNLPADGVEKAGLWQVDVSDDGRLLPLTPRLPEDIQQVLEFRRALGLVCRVAVSLLVPADMPPSLLEELFEPETQAKNRSRLPVEIYGWSLLYQLPHMRGRAVIDSHDSFCELPAFYESPLELVDRSTFLTARGIPHRPLALLTQPEDFVPAQTGRGNRNLFASDASLHRTCPLHKLWPG